MWQVLVIVGDISKVLEGHLGTRQVQPECQVQRAAILITKDTMNKKREAPAKKRGTFWPQPNG